MNWEEMLKNQDTPLDYNKPYGNPKAQQSRVKMAEQQKVQEEIKRLQGLLQAAQKVLKDQHQANVTEATTTAMFNNN